MIFILFATTSVSDMICDLNAVSGCVIDPRTCSGCLATSQASDSSFLNKLAVIAYQLCVTNMTGVTSLTANTVCGSPSLSKSLSVSQGALQPAFGFTVNSNAVLASYPNSGSDVCLLFQQTTRDCCTSDPVCSPSAQNVTVCPNWSAPATYVALGQSCVGVNASDNADSYFLVAQRTFGSNVQLNCTGAHVNCTCTSCCRVGFACDTACSSTSTPLCNVGAFSPLDVRLALMLISVLLFNILL